MTPIKNRGFMKMVVLVALVACHAGNGYFKKIAGMNNLMDRRGCFQSNAKISCHHAGMPAIF